MDGGLGQGRVVVNVDDRCYGIENLDGRFAVPRNVNAVSYPECILVLEFVRNGNVPY